MRWKLALGLGLLGLGGVGLYLSRPASANAPKASQQRKKPTPGGSPSPKPSDDLDAWIWPIEGGKGIITVDGDWTLKPRYRGQDKPLDRDYYRPHRGPDIGRGLTTDDNLLAVWSGRVIHAGLSDKSYLKYLGNYVVLELDRFRGRKLWVLYAHADRVLVKAGDKVSRGQPIAKAGTTGNSSGVHLHFETWHRRWRYQANNNHVTDSIPYLQDSEYAPNPVFASDAIKRLPKGTKITKRNRKTGKVSTITV